MSESPVWLSSVLQVMLALVVPAFWAVMLRASLRRDPRRLRVGFYAVFAVYSIVGFLGQVVSLVAEEISAWVTLIFLVLLGLGLAVLPFLLIANGLTVLRRESRSLGNMLTLVAGVGLLLSPTVLLLPTVLDSWWTLSLSALLVGLGLTAGFLFLGFVTFTLVYARVARKSTGNAVIVLGSRVVGDRVTRLLAGRLRAGLEASARSGDTPVPLVVSGGRAPTRWFRKARRWPAGCATMTSPRP